MSSPAPTVGTLRGAGVDVTGRSVARAAFALVLAGVAVLAVLLFIAGASKNSHIDRLRHDGVTVQMRVSGCLGLLGGSGSNAAGDRCHGSLVLGGRRYDEIVPGSSLHRPGSTVTVVAVRDDPSILATPHELATERASWHVFIAPGILSLAVLASAATVAIVATRRRRAGAPASAA